MLLAMPDGESRMYLDFPGLWDDGPTARRVRGMAEAGFRVPGVLNMLACRADWTAGLNQLTHAVMRGPGGLPIWQRELIAGLTSRGNHCVF
jgi:hypothetical protein